LQRDGQTQKPGLTWKDFWKGSEKGKRDFLHHEKTIVITSGRGRKMVTLKMRVLAR